MNLALRWKVSMGLRSAATRLSRKYLQQGLELLLWRASQLPLL